MDKKVLIIGTGRIGCAVAGLLSSIAKFEITLGGNRFDGEEAKALMAHSAGLVSTVAIDVSDCSRLCNYLASNHFDAVIAAVPKQQTMPILMAALEMNLAYFDLCEDLEHMALVRQAAIGAASVVVPHCGLVPGISHVIASALYQQFDEVEHVGIDFGALPQTYDSPFCHSADWGLEGLISKYSEQNLPSQPQEVVIDSQHFEAIAIHGGQDELTHIDSGRTTSIDYRMLSYQGFSARLNVVLNDLNLKEEPALLKSVLSKTVTKTKSDNIWLAVRLTGTKDGQPHQERYQKGLGPQVIDGMTWSATQFATAAGLSAVLYEVVSKDMLQGYVAQEALDWSSIQQNPFGCFFKE